MSSSPLRLGTRGSALALAQSGHVAEAITAATGRPVELVRVVTKGDTDRGAIAQIGGTGVFVTALREALAAGEVDLAVHSYKDLPTAPAVGLTIAAVPPREDPRDVVVARDGLTLGELPTGSRVGTGSPRRTAQLRGLGLGLEVEPIRGNVDTRIGYVRDGELDAVVLARAGLARLGRLDEVTEVVDPLQVLPAPAQGALAVECRAGSTCTGSSTSVTSSSRPSRARPARARTTASSSPPVTKPMRVSTLPRTGTTSRPSPRPRSCASRRGEPVPMRLPAGSSPSTRPSRATSTSRGSCRGGTAATTRPSAGAVGRSL